MATQTGTEHGTEAEPEPRTGAGRVRDPGDAQRRWTTAAWLVPLLLVCVAASVRFYRLDVPPDIFFDETYYVDDARALLERGVEEGFAVHPPVGKALIAGSMALMGDSPVGWRAASAAAGTVTVLFTYLAGLRLLRRRGSAALAALLVAVDGLALTMSRISMLDSLLAMFTVIGFWWLLVDRDRLWRGVPEEPVDPAAGQPLPRRPHTARWAAGLVFGLAMATKWSAVLAIGAAGLLVLGNELAFRRRTTGRWLTAWPRAAATAALTLVLVPAAVYALSYAGWFANFELTRPGEQRCPDPDACAVDVPTMVGDWFGEQAAVARFHAGLEAEHPYRSSAITWPLMLRPIAYYYKSCSPGRAVELAAEGEECVVAEGSVAHILALGNPGVWWPALAAYVALGWHALRRRDWRACAILTFLLGQYLPWIAASRPLFFFYMTPVVPFIALAVAFAADACRRFALLRWVPGALALIAVAAFVFWFPLWTGLEISKEAWQLRIWLSSWI